MPTWTDLCFWGLASLWTQYIRLVCASGSVGRCSVTTLLPGGRLLKEFIGLMDVSWVSFCCSYLHAFIFFPHCSPQAGPGCSSSITVNLGGLHLFFGISCFNSSNFIRLSLARLHWHNVFLKILLYIYN